MFGLPWTRDTLRWRAFKEKSNGNPSLLEVRAEYLKDYLCARGMALCPHHTEVGKKLWMIAATSRGRKTLCVDTGDRWEGRVSEVHEGGRPFGSSVRVFQVSRTNVDFGEDVPTISPFDEGDRIEILD